MQILKALLVALALFAGPGATAQTTTDQPNGTIATGSDSTPDAAIETRMRAILDELGGYGDVSITVNSGVMTLRGETDETADATELTALAARIEGVVQVKNEVQATADISRRLDPAMDRLASRLTQILSAFPLLLVALFVFGLIVFAGIAISRLKEPWERLAPNAFIAQIYRQIIRLLFIIGGLVIALDIMGATALLGTILGAAGIIGLAIGFAVRDTVENFIASVMLSFRQPFRPNDVVEVEGHEQGKVIRLTSRATILLSFDGNHIRIPNAIVFKSRITNFTRNPERRFLFEIGVASDADLAAIRKLATQVVRDLAFTLAEPEPLVWIDRIGDGAIFLTVTGWIDQRETSIHRARGEALRQVKNAIEAAGVEVPDTTYRVQVLGGNLLGIEEADTVQPASPGQVSGPDPEDPDPVDTANEDALDRMIDGEREDESRSDLLSEDAPTE
ncbi:mechanosensitive ion channel domain-containing protein [Aestuariibius insulae]|uniref:mechanosensitive ion channel domain-containing protein n=1 Tax=Aestuariibius insulae TaxID=2058287 RepID=UPI00345E61F2